MIYAIEAAMAFGTAARRDQAQVRVQAFADSHPRWGPAADIRAVQEGPRQPDDLDNVAANGIYVNFRLPVRADLDAIVADLQARPGIIGGWIRWHFCEHDSSGPCHDVTVVQL